MAPFLPGRRFRGCSRSLTAFFKLSRRCCPSSSSCRETPSSRTRPFPSTAHHFGLIAETRLPPLQPNRIQARTHSEKKKKNVRQRRPLDAPRVRHVGLRAAQPGAHEAARYGGALPAAARRRQHAPHPAAAGQGAPRARAQAGGRGQGV